MKRTVCLMMMAALTLCLAVGVCGQEAIPQGYQQIIERYTQAGEAGWDEEKMLEEGLNLLAAGRDDAGYILMDLDGDGREELLIAPDAQDDFYGGMVFDLYAMEGEETVKVFSSGERDRYYYIGKDLFVHQGSSSAQDSFDTTMRYEKGGLTDLGYPSDREGAERLSLTLFGGSVSLAIPNPWQQTTAQGILEQVGVTFGVPQGAEDVSYSAMGSQLAQMRFVWEGKEWTARIKPADSFEDISGMYYSWDQEEDYQVLWCEGKIFSAGQGEEKVQLCLWYDLAPGLMYSLSTADSAQTTQIKTLAQEIYLPAQDDVE